MKIKEIGINSLLVSGGYGCLCVPKFILDGPGPERWISDDIASCFSGCCKALNFDIYVWRGIGYLCNTE